MQGVGFAHSTKEADNNGGVAGDPYAGKLFSVRFKSEDISFDLAAPGYYSGAVTLQEV